jgi:hypothetical protein
MLKVVNGILMCIGLYILLRSTNYGISYADEYVRINGGHLNNESYNSLLNSYTSIYRNIGSIIFGINLFFLFKKSKFPK